MKKGLIKCTTIIFCISFCVSLSSCGGEEYDQMGTLKRGLEKSYIGAPLTKQEQREVEGYRKWEREYDAKQYNSKYYR